MNRLVHALSILIALGSLSLAETIEITANSLNVRSGPSTRNRVISVARRGQRYAVAKSSGSWRQVTLSSGSTGWLYGPRYTRVVNVPPATTARPARPAAPAPNEECRVGRLNVRTGAGTRFRVLGQLRRGDRVQVTSQSGRWKRLVYKGRTAFAWGAYLRPIARAPATSPPVPVGSGGRRSSRVGFVALRASGPGFYSYKTPSRRWGKPQLVYGLERAARIWSQRGRRPRIAIGDISRENGGRFRPHVTHRLGEDVDIRLIRNDGREASVSRFQSAYSRSLTRESIEIVRSQIPTELILFNDRAIPGVRSYAGHDSHWHYRMR
ncbi:MAG: penicillin-insensitive murein endopeptidase [Planctomycetes bacterium]|nr:penicillin-insensitive murein endopeptidase [Planctomycetota bacterium]